MIKRPLNSRFSDKARQGIKFTTIREKSWPIGKPIMLYNWSGAPYRSKHRDVVAVVVLTATPIVIGRTDHGMLYTYARNETQGRELWECEGFDSKPDMDAWFSSKMKVGETLHMHLMRFKLLEGRDA